MITILYQSAWPLGGGTSFTAHLARVLAPDVRIIRLGEREERKLRTSGELTYRITSLDAALRIDDGPILFTIGDPKIADFVWEELAKKPNFWACFHDPNEFKLFSHWKYLRRDRVICTRVTGLRHIPDGHFIPMPYVRSFPTAPEKKEFGCSLARTCSYKNSVWLMEANRELRMWGREIQFLGQWDRLWHYSSVLKKFPEYPTALSGYPRECGAGPALCSNYELMFDMSIFKQDGGGTQYSLLEALDAGSVPVITEDWASYPGPARDWSIAVKDAASIVKKFANRDHLDLGALQEVGQKYLNSVHNPAAIAQAYRDILYR
jgi:hypothetical protein